MDFDMGDDSFYSAQSPTSSLAVQQWIDESHDHMDSSPYTELTPHSPGEQARQDQTPPATPRFDPAALLNPKSAPKRPASSEGSERAEPTSAGQVSLVERLHNVQERAASPAKRVKTADEQRKKASSNGTNFNGGSALDLNKNRSAPVPPPPQVDLTMSK